MPYDAFLGERIQKYMDDKKVPFISKKMMGGLVFMVREKMCCGIHIDKKYGDSLLMLKIGELAYQEAIKSEVCLPMDFTGRPMKGYVFVTPKGFDLESDMAFWLDKALAFNLENHK